MNKEQILSKHNWSGDYPNSGFDPHTEILEAMDEYTKQENISIIKFIEQSRLTYRKTHDKWEWWEQTDRHSKTLHEYTTEELYELYQQSKNKP